MEIGAYTEKSGRRFSLFAGNNYLGLSDHPDIKNAAIKSINKYGLNFAASRHTTGTSEIHLELERELSEFKNKEDSVVYASGYMGNAILFQVLRDQYSLVLADEISHPSIRDGIPRDVESLHYFRHGDLQHLEELLFKNKNQSALIITEGIFALTGEISPIDKIFSLSEKYNAILIIDDAHATGVLGESGKGTPEHFNLQDEPNIYQTETMSKALGVYGGFISGSQEIVNLIREKSNICLGSTALPPPLVAAACASVRIIRHNAHFRPVLAQKASEIRRGIIELGYQTNSAPTPIIPVYFESREQARNLSFYLEEHGIIAPYISYPVKMDRFIVRITVSVNHTSDQIEELLETLKNWKKQH